MGVNKYNEDNYNLYNDREILIDKEKFPINLAGGYINRAGAYYLQPIFQKEYAERMSESKKPNVECANNSKRLRNTNKKTKTIFSFADGKHLK